MPELKPSTPKETMSSPRLFTPGPLNTSAGVRGALGVDVGSRSPAFIRTVQDIRASVLKLANRNEANYTTVPLQGSGTFAVESVLATAIGKEPNAKALILSNGSYGDRMVKICAQAGFRHATIRSSETKKLSGDDIHRWLRRNGEDITLVAFVHCETSTGIINPLDEIVEAIRSVSDAWILVDAMSTLGAVPITAETEFLVSSANKCVQGVPGFGLIVASRAALAACEGRCGSLSLDLAAQSRAFDDNGQFRFTPPTHALLAFAVALRELAEEGGVEARMRRYQSNNRLLLHGMKELGFQELLGPEASGGWIITSFLYPSHHNFRFDAFYSRLAEKGQIIYPGKLWAEVRGVQVTKVDSFRIGNIGDLHADDFHVLLGHISDVLRDMQLPLPLDAAEHKSTKL